MNLKRKIFITILCLGFIIVALNFEERGFVALTLADLLFWSIYGTLGVAWFILVARYLKKSGLDVSLGILLLLFGFGTLWPISVLLWIWANEFCSRFLEKYFLECDWYKSHETDTGAAISDEEKIEAMKRLLNKE